MGLVRLGFFLSVIFVAPIVMAKEASLKNGVEQVLNDLEEPKVFNAKTCATYINNVTDYLFRQPADHFIPKTADDIAVFKAQGPSLIKRIFQIRVALLEQLQKFNSRHEISEDCVLKIREGLQYARYTEEYLLDWLVRGNVVEYKEAPILGGDEPFVMKNPKFSELTIQAGDVMMIRGISFVSAMIARIGDEEGNFSHLALVAEDGKGRLHVVESLIQYGLVVTPLDEWRKAQDARVALFRHKDQVLSRRAARFAYDWGLKHLKYDFEMDDSNYDKVFCSEVVRYAYDKASDGKLLVPQFRSHVTKFKGGPYPKSLGVSKDTLFAPYDIEVDPRFEFVAEGKHYPLLRQVRLQDAILQSMYGWMIEKNYRFYGSLLIASQVYIGKIIRQFGFLKDQFPRYMPTKTMESVLQFQTVADVLEKNIYDKEKEYYNTHGYLPSFLEMMAANENYRRQDYELYEAGEKSKFHSFFRGGRAP